MRSGQKTVDTENWDIGNRQCTGLQQLCHHCSFFSEHSIPGKNILKPNNWLCTELLIQAGEIYYKLNTPRKTEHIPITGQTRVHPVKHAKHACECDVVTEWVGIFQQLPYNFILKYNVQCTRGQIHRNCFKIHSKTYLNIIFRQKSRRLKTHLKSIHKSCLVSII